MADQTNTPQAAAPDSNAVTPALEDKGLWVAMIAAALTPFVGWLSMKLGIAIDPVSLATFIVTSVLPMITYIVMHKYKSAQVLIAETHANAMVEGQRIQSQAQISPEAAAAALNQLFGAAVQLPTPAAPPLVATSKTAPSASTADAQAAAVIAARNKTALELGADLLKSPAGPLTNSMTTTTQAAAPTMSTLPGALPPLPPSAPPVIDLNALFPNASPGDRAAIQALLDLQKKS
jgi:hypothetical protein